jgi:hypothetical protein
VTRIKVTPKTWLHYATEQHHGKVEVRVQDIGATIGTEILDDEGNRLVAYRPGTRYGSYAEELAAGHLHAALEKVETSAPDFRVRYFVDKLRAALQEVVDADGAGPWTPDGEEEDDDQW